MNPVVMQFLVEAHVNELHRSAAPRRSCRPQRRAVISGLRQRLGHRRDWAYASDCACGC